jgi:4-hydroxybenzoate polyprenyltransferase
VAAGVVVACGWAYNAGAKGTAFSWLPYAVAFGALPAVATLSDVPARRPPGWAMAAGALLGVAAHLANVLPDLRADAATGVRGLPHRLGARATAVGGAVVLLAASVVILLGPSGAPDAVSWAGFVAAAVLGGGAAVVAVRDPSSRRYFPAVIAVAVLDVLLFAVSGVRL